MPPLKKRGITRFRTHSQEQEIFPPTSIFIFFCRRKFAIIGKRAIVRQKSSAHRHHDKNHRKGKV